MTEPEITFNRNIVLSKEALEKILSEALDLPKSASFSWNFRGGQMYDDEPLSVTLRVVHEVPPKAPNEPNVLRDGSRIYSPRP
jgi:hypothetical protein